MIAHVEGRASRFRPVEPAPPLLRQRGGAGLAVVSLAVNGIEYRATLALDRGGIARAEDVAAMLEGLAGEIRRGGRG
jgi:hypothetical protein